MKAQVGLPPEEAIGAPTIALEMLACPVTGGPLGYSANGSCLVSPAGRTYPIRGGVVRFVEGESYAAAFGWQWRTFHKAQLDSHTKTTISRDRLQRCLGGSFDMVRGKKVLEAGCGSGRFTEVLLAEGATVIALDLSSAVDALRANLPRHPKLTVLQADIRVPPIALGSMDVVVCIGVLQHTPSPEESIAALARLLKPGGALIIDHYPPDYALTWSRRLARSVALGLPRRWGSWMSVALSRALLPLHKRAWRVGERAARRRKWLHANSPLVDYYGAYPLDNETLEKWAILDTHDTLTDRYKHLRSEEQIVATLAANGLVEAVVSRGGNGIEARAWRPNVGRK